MKTNDTKGTEVQFLDSDESDDNILFQMTCGHTISPIANMNSAMNTLKTMGDNQLDINQLTTTREKMTTDRTCLSSGRNRTNLFELSVDEVMPLTFRGTEQST